MKTLVFGLGSIGARHVRNLKALRPDCLVVGVDPRLAAPLLSAVSNGYHDNLPVTHLFEDWRVALERHADADAAIIASPTPAHLEQMSTLRHCGVPFYVEKPLCAIDQIDEAAALLDAERMRRARCAVGFQYRFHPVFRDAAPVIVRHGHARFYACDDLLSRYGPDCLGMIAAHPIDTALWLLGPASAIEMETNGLAVRGTIRHARGLSEHDYRIDAKARISTVSTDGAGGHSSEGWSLYADDGMYRDALEAWLRWALGGETRNSRTATLADGLAQARVAARVSRWQIAHSIAREESIMLEIAGTLAKDCPRGQDVAALHQNGTKRMPTLGGWKNEPRYEPTYTAGLPFGVLHPVAPVALKAGDVLVADAETGEALRVKRDGKVVWSAERFEGNQAQGA